jgi:hypothetical protein
MTPKEKAFELFDKYMQPIDELHKYPMCFATAKQCALIAVDEILKQCYAALESYWYEVQQEIEKL